MDSITVPSFYFLLSLAGSVSKSLKLFGLVECLSWLMLYGLWAAGENLLTFLQLWLWVFSFVHDIAGVSGGQMSDTIWISVKLSLSLCCLSPGSYWPLDFRKYGILLMEPASRPPPPALWVCGTVWWLNDLSAALPDCWVQCFCLPGTLFLPWWGFGKGGFKCCCQHMLRTQVCKTTYRLYSQTFLIFRIGPNHFRHIWAKNSPIKLNPLKNRKLFKKLAFTVNWSSFCKNCKGNVFPRVRSMNLVLQIMSG